MPRRLVDDDDGRVEQHHLGEKQLLLVAAGKLARQQILTAGADIEIMDGIVQRRRFPAGIDLEEATEFLQRSKREIDTQILGEQQSLALAVFAQINDPGLQAVFGLGEMHRFTEMADRAPPGPQAKHALHKLGPARADKTGKTEDFAFAQAETGILRITGNGETLHLKNRLTLAASVPVG